MMDPTREQLDALADALANTKPTELDCDGVPGQTDDTLVSIAYVDGLGRARAVAVESGNDVKRERLKLQAHI